MHGRAHVIFFIYDMHAHTVSVLDKNSLFLRYQFEVVSFVIVNPVSNSRLLIKENCQLSSDQVKHAGIIP